MGTSLVAWMGFCNSSFRIDKISGCNRGVCYKEVGDEDRNILAQE